MVTVLVTSRLFYFYICTVPVASIIFLQLLWWQHQLSVKSMLPVLQCHL
uniref:Uncharacterized protein n=1 Tax=Anguilla anguilla TaxID=7936 RepID=A0A0E9RLD1_ANGAN